MFPDLAIPLSYQAIYSPALLRAFLFLTTSQHGEHFLPCIFCRVYPKRKDFVGECPSVVIHFDDVDREHFWVWIIGWDEVVKCDAVVVDVAKAMDNG
jgi:hypothetical protein